ncbi:cell division protein ZipA [Oceanimonas sp. CAM02]|uniref:cell division protein ZipA n=1 Tax=Oceanimonas sp. CAM02 TaxID=3080336 RepID=UPI0029363CF2|nr:cell division protein ZipA [Oceanimonas sp. CAM02]MDV2856425.1 cell division protein ZipA [Oceanimonas sp. CAM02]
MQDLRVILIILGAMAIAALLIHGLWSSKKDRQPSMRNKPMGKVASEPGSEDSFDQDGIGQVRVVAGQKNATAAKQESAPKREEPHFSALDDEDDEQPVVTAEPKPVVQNRQPEPEPEDEFDPLFDEPVAKREPAAEEAQADAGPQEPEQTMEQAPPAEPEVLPEPEPQAPLREVPRTWQDVYVINLMARPNQQIDGNALMRALTNNGFHFGDMDIFHHHQTPAGQGQVLFSLINMVKPGTFNPKEMTGFSTPGVSIFMQLPRPGMAKNQFNLMVQTAENLAEELDALLFDVERSPVSPDYLAHCREQLRDYDSQAQ